MISLLSKRRTTRTKLLLSKLVLGSALITGLLSGCGKELRDSNYKVQIPLLQAVPTPGNCTFSKYGDQRRCIILLEEDFEAIVQELKAACLALGGSPEECQVEET